MKYIDNLIIGTSWCSLRNFPNHEHVSKEIFQEEWLIGNWSYQIERYLEPRMYYVYVSLGTDIDPLLDHRRFDYNISANDVKQLKHQYHYHAGLLQGAVYAFNNSCNYLWIEQDCMVKGLDKIYELSKNEMICYGYGKSSFHKGWASQSLIWVNNLFLPIFIHKLVDARIHESIKGIPEVIFHNLFKEHATLWAFGYDRKRPIDWDEEYFFAQQLNDQEINNFISI